VRWRLRIGRVRGIDLWIHPSWLLVFTLVTWAAWSGYAELYPAIGRPARGAMAVVTGFAFFACLTAHELAHATVARRFGIHVLGITLFLFGGVAEIRGEVPTPAREFAVALAGPALSVLLGGLFGAGALSTGAHPTLEGVFVTLSLVNLGVAVFNLVPGLPLDGGRILRAALWRRWGDHRRATRVAAAGGNVLAVALGLLGIGLVASGEPFGLWYLPMAVFLWFLARSAAHGRAPDPGALALDRREGEAPQPGP
jgi:Zn-dependent protease